jgi:hypothetical protein
VQRIRDVAVRARRGADADACGLDVKEEVAKALAIDKAPEPQKLALQAELCARYQSCCPYQKLRQHATNVQ